MTDIQTKSFRLVVESTEGVLARLESMSPSDRSQVSPDWIARVRSSPSADPWTHGFAMIDRDSGARIGSCGFKGPPGDGVVEIAYGVDEAFRGKGYATEAAQGITAFAFGRDGVTTVRAHTLPEPNASTRVLEKCGFRFAGLVVDPEDGPVWRWELDIVTYRTIETINRFNEAFNRHDVDGVMALMTNDCTFENTRPAPEGERIQGEEAVRAFWDSFFERSPEARFRTEEIMAAGDRCVVRWRYDWVREGRPGHVCGVDVFRVREGKVAEKCSYVKG